MKHAILSASASERWMECPPSARQEAKVKSTGNSYTNEGGFAHEVADNELKFKLGLISQEDYMRKIDMFQGVDYYDESLKEYVNIYVSLVMEKVSEAKARSGDFVAVTEQRYDFSNYVPEGFGTSDATIISDGVLEIVDLKYGLGVTVSAYGNTQMRLYALGALNYFSCIYDIHTVKMTIAQVRRDFITTEEMSVKDLLDWAENELKPRARLAWEGKGEYKSGSHCQFCRIKTRCEARANKNLELAKYDFEDAGLLTFSDINAILKLAGELKDWVNDIQEFAADQAINHGAKWEGFKLVHGKSNRAYTNKEDVKKALIANGYPEEKIYEPAELKGITAMEKLLGKKKFSAILEKPGLVHKPDGKLTLVDDSDPRPEVSSAADAAADFAEEFTEELPDITDGLLD